MAKRLTTRVSAGAALVTGLSAMGMGIITAAPASAVTVTQDYECTYSVLNVGQIGGNPNVSVDLEVDLPQTMTVGDTLASDVTATVTIPEERRASLYSLLGVRSIDGPNAQEAAAEDGGLNTQGARNKAGYILSNGQQSVNGSIPLSFPMTPVPASGELVVTASGAVEPTEVTQAGTYTVTAGDFQAYIRGYSASGDYKTNITMNCTNVSADKTVGTVEVLPADDGSTDEPTEPPTDEPTEPPTDEPTGEPTEPPTGEPTEPSTDEPTEEPAPEVDNWFTEPDSLPIEGDTFIVAGEAAHDGTLTIVQLDEDKDVITKTSWDVSKGANEKAFPFAEATHHVRVISEDCVAKLKDGTVITEENLNSTCNAEYYAPWADIKDDGTGDDAADKTDDTKGDDAKADDKGADQSGQPEIPDVVQTDGFTQTGALKSEDGTNSALALGGLLFAGAGAGALLVARRRRASQL